MDWKTGVLHKTTIQTAVERQHPATSESVRGNKRPHSEVTQHPGPPPPVSEDDSAKAASDATNKPSRLTASPIKLIGPASDVSEYSQRRVISATPTSTFDPTLLLSHPRYGLPEKLTENFARLGVRSIYPWQKNCLSGPGLLEGTRNLVYTAPTGGGKSLVADVLMLKRVLERKDYKALLILPYVALVQEKVRWLRQLVQGIAREPPGADGRHDGPGLWQRRADEDAIKVVGFFGGGKVRSSWHDFDIGICTFEKVCFGLQSCAPFQI